MNDVCVACIHTISRMCSMAIYMLSTKIRVILIIIDDVNMTNRKIRTYLLNILICDT